MSDNKDKVEDARKGALQNLDTATMASVDFYHMETITLESDIVDYEEGFRIYYNDEWEAIKFSYWQLNNINNSQKQHYIDVPLTTSEVEQVKQWFDRNLVQEVIVKRERTIHFKKDPDKGKMIDL